jgi:hypothetical protein
MKVFNDCSISLSRLRLANNTKAPECYREKANSLLELLHKIKPHQTPSGYASTRLARSDFAQRRRLESSVDFLLSSVLQRQQTASYDRMLKDSACYQTMLQCECTLHVTASVVDIPGDWQKTIVDSPCTRIIAGLPSLNYLQEWLWCCQGIGRE